MKIILLGDRSFVGRGLAEKISQAGHTCLVFGRGKEQKTGNTIRGPMERFLENPHWPESADWLINFMIVRDGDIPDNVAFCEKLLQLARKLRCKGIIQISSIMAYRFDEKVITEKSALEREFEGKMPYAAVKMATDSCLLDHADGLKILFVRPGFVLGSGHPGAMIGTGAQLPGGGVLLLGNPRQFFPVISREKVHEVILGILKSDAWDHGQVFLAVHPKSPSKRDYLRACCDELGVGRYVIRMGAWFWLPAALAGELLARLMGNRSPQVLARILLTFKGITYNPSATEKTLGVDLGFDWRKALRESYDAETPNFSIKSMPDAKGADLSGVKKILFIGFGGIVRQKHLPALKELGFAGSLDVFDPAPGRLPKAPYPVNLLDDPAKSEAELVVVASPPMFHGQALDRLPPGASLVLVEKPLALTLAEAQRWADRAAKGRTRFAVIHNYRVKSNVLAFLKYLGRRNPGEVRACRFLLNNPSLLGDPAAWRRDERRNKTLLYDFGIHFLDVACLLAGEFKAVGETLWNLDSQGRTAEIRGRVRFANFPVDFVITQGHGVVRHQVYFDFANYGVRLGFFPDTFTAYHGPDMIATRFTEWRKDFWEILRYIALKIHGRDPDPSHLRVYRECLRAWRDGTPSPLDVAQLLPTYRALEEISKVVYPKA